MAKGEVWVLEFKNSATGEFEPTDDVELTRETAKEGLKWWRERYPEKVHRVRRYTPAEGQNDE
jgi:hypothetical protein